ncbi:hypothetical protein EVAR_3442_1 [Eumeta japonica]|uniref:Uncharacterized protein n=1 Tax=Eumeta variegata TaxID=151549 RepID=A0A4C1SSH0_EUMVA|nr:hypothetical protein EVAR_3442_1 [Eumeta japonica]
MVGNTVFKISPKNYASQQKDSYPCDVSCESLARASLLRLIKAVTSNKRNNALLLPRGDESVCVPGGRNVCRAQLYRLHKYQGRLCEAAFQQQLKKRVMEDKSPAVRGSGAGGRRARAPERVHPLAV